MVRFLSSLSGEEKNRDVFGVLRGPCTLCNECEEFSPDTSEGEGWNAVALLKCATCQCTNATHVALAGGVESDVLKEEAAESTPTVSERALERCVDTLADFMRGYLPLHGLQSQQWRLLPVLLWVEGTIYTLDEYNEEAIQDLTKPECDETPLWRTLRSTLAHLNLLDARVEQELSEGSRYWRLERALCRGGKKPVRAGQVERCASGKSFDYRLLHAITLAACGMRAEPELLDMMRQYEALIEARDDISDYADDVERNSFNVLHMLSQVHGASKARAEMLARVHKIETRYRQLLARVAPHYRERHEAYVRREKGGVWLWESIIPEVAASPHRTPSARRGDTTSNSPLYSLAQVRRAIAVLQHTWLVCGPLLPLPRTGALPLLAPVLKQALRAVNVSAHATSALEADGHRYAESLRQLAPRLSQEQVWRLSRWRAYDTLMVLQGLCEAYMITLTDALRAVVVTLDVQYCLAFDYREFRLTSVKDVEGRVALSSMEVDPRQLNAAVLLAQRAGVVEVEAALRQRVNQLHDDCVQHVLPQVASSVAEAYQSHRDTLLDKLF